MIVPILPLLCCILSMTSVLSDDTPLPKITSEEWSMHASGNGRLLVIFSEESYCPTCQEMIDLITDIVSDPDWMGDYRVGESTDSKLISSLGLGKLPALVFLRDNSHVLYDGETDPDKIIEWLELSRSKATQILHDDSFEHLTQASTGATTGDWLVAFYEDSCRNVLPVIEAAGIRIRQKTNVAAVDVSKNTALAKRFAIKNCPEIILFKQGKMYRYEIPLIDPPSLKSFAEAWYKNSKAVTVLPPKSKFDFLTESIADFIKVQLEGEKRNLVISGICGFLVTLVIVTVCCCRSVAGANKGKEKSE